MTIFISIFRTILDVVKTLNSAQKPWQLSLPIFLGVFLGLLPLFNPLHIAIPLLCLFINLNFSVLVASFGAVLAVSTLIDPLLHKVGHGLLTAESLQGFWALLYNLIPVKFTWFYNTVNMGSLVAALVLSVPFFFLANFIIRKLRGLLVILSALPVLSFFLAREEEEEEEDVDDEEGSLSFGKIFFFKRMIAAVLMVGLVWIFSFFFLDSLVEKGVEHMASSILGTEVNLGSLTLNLPKGGGVSKIEIADPDNPGKNLVEIEKGVFRFSIIEALERKLVIHEATLADIRFNTKRSQKAREVKGEGGLFSLKGLSADFQEAWNRIRNLPLEAKIDFLMKLDLGTFKKLKTGQADLKGLVSKWTGLYKSWNDKIKARTQKLDELRKRIQTIKTPQDVQDIFRESQELIRQVQADYKELESLDKQLAEDLKKFQNLEKDFLKLAKDDWEALRKKYTLDAQGGIQLSGALLGEDFHQNSKGIIEGYRRVMQLLGVLLPKTPKRERGEWIRFSEENPTPKVILEKLHLSVHFLGTKVQGEAKDVSSDPQIYGRPGVVTLSGSKTSAYESLLFKALLNKKEGVSQDGLTAEIKGLHLEQITTPIGIVLKKPTLDLMGKIKIEKNCDINGEIQVRFSQVNFQMSEKKPDELAQMIQEALKAVEGFSVTAHITGTLDNWKISLSSDLDKRLTAGIKDKLSLRNERFRESLYKVFHSTFEKENQTVVQGISSLETLQKQIKGQKGSCGTVQDAIKEEFTLKNLQKKLLSNPIKKPLDDINKLNPFKKTTKDPVKELDKFNPFK